MENSADQISASSNMDSWTYPILVGNAEYIFEEPEDPISIAIHKEGHVRCLTCNLWLVKDELFLDAWSLAIEHAGTHVITYEENEQSDLAKQLQKRIREVEKPPGYAPYLSERKWKSTFINSLATRYHARQMWTFGAILTFGIALSFVWDWFNLNEIFFPFLESIMSWRVIITATIMFIVILFGMIGFLRPPGYRVWK